MKCDNCSANIDAGFVFAIKNNQCPACGKNIMQEDALELFSSLKAVLLNNIDDMDKAASIIMTSFDVKKKADFNEVVVNTGDDTNDDNVDQAPHTVKSITSDPKLAEVKAISEKLKMLREEALHDAEVEHWGLGEANMFSDADSVQEMIQNQKKQSSYDRIVSGTGGKNSFSRGG